MGAAAIGLPAYLPLQSNIYIQTCITVMATGKCRPRKKHTCSAMTLATVSWLAARAVASVSCCCACAGPPGPWSQCMHHIESWVNKNKQTGIDHISVCLGQERGRTLTFEYTSIKGVLIRAWAFYLFAGKKLRWSQSGRPGFFF